MNFWDGLSDFAEKIADRNKFADDLLGDKGWGKIIDKSTVHIASALGFFKLFL